MLDRKTYEQFIFGNIFILANKLQTAGDDVCDEITVKQWFLLLLISKMEKKDPSITDIAEFTSNTRQNVKKMIDILAARQFVTVQKQEKDRRNLRVTLTAKTFDFFARFEPLGNAFLDQIFQGIPTENLSIARETLEKLDQNLSKRWEMEK